MEAYWTAWLDAQDRQLALLINEERETRNNDLIDAEIAAEIEEQDEADFQEWWALYRFDDSVRSIQGDWDDDQDSFSDEWWNDGESDASSVSTI